MSLMSAKAPSAEVAGLRQELRSTEDLLQRQTELCFQLTRLESHKRLPLPLYNPFGIGRDVIPLSSFFSLLAELPPESVLSPIPPPARAADFVRPSIRSTPLVSPRPHSTIHTVIVHSGTNDDMSRQSSKLHYELESLTSTVESLGRRCVLSGPTLTVTKSSNALSVFSICTCGCKVSVLQLDLVLLLVVLTPFGPDGTFLNIMGCFSLN